VLWVAQGRSYRKEKCRVCTAIDVQKWRRMELFMLIHENSAQKVGKCRGIARLLGARGK
jgi:hypothetical protein